MSPESPHKHDWKYNPETGEYERSNEPYNDNDKENIEENNSADEFSLAPKYQLESPPREFNWLFVFGLGVWAVLSPDPLGEAALASYLLFH